MRCSLLFFVVCGAVAGALLASMAPATLRDVALHDQEFRLLRPSDDPVEITGARWFFLPFLFGDFDLQMDIAIGEGAEVDLLLRQVEPRLAGGDFLPFAGRFTALRLSSQGDGVGWRTREQALLGPPGDGVGLAPGYPATVWVQARGRMLRANVAGKWQPWHEADDDYGMLTILAKGGNAVLHSFLVTPRGARSWLWSLWTWAVLGALGALVLAAAALAHGEHRAMSGGGRFVVGSFLVRGFVGSGVVLVLSAHWLREQADLDLCLPEPAALLLLLSGCLVVALVLLSRQAGVVVLGLLCAAAIWLVAAGISRLQHDTRAVDAVFGPDAGSQLSEAHAQLVRGPAGLHDIARPGPRVFLLGGELLYDRGIPGEHLELLLGRELRGALQKPVDVPCLPTEDGYAAQQWQLYTQFFTGYHPEVIVLGVGPVEDGDDEATGKPRSSPEQLAAAVRAAREHCEQNERQLVLFADARMTEGLLAQLRQLAGSDLPLVIAEPDDLPVDCAKKLATAILPFLR